MVQSKLSSELESAGIKLAIALLQHFITNPASIAEEGDAIHQVALLSTQADALVNAGTTWTCAGAPDSTKA